MNYYSLFKKPHATNVDVVIDVEKLPGGKQKFIREDKNINNTPYRLTTHGLFGETSKKEPGQKDWVSFTARGVKKRKTFRKKSLKKRRTFRRK